MTTITLLIVAAVAVLFPTVLVLSAKSVIAKVAASLVALGLAAFCGFGFLASGELAEAARWPWQIGYAILGIGALATPALLVLKKPRRADHTLGTPGASSSNPN